MQMSIGVMVRMPELRTFSRTSKYLGKFGKEKRAPTRFWLGGRSLVRGGASSEGPAFTFRQMIKNGQLKSDFKQLSVVEELQKVYDDIQNYSPRKFFSGKSPRGLYVHGSVGSGKTTLMDIFFHSIRTKSKRRSHFNNFMADVHFRMHQLKKKPNTSLNTWGKSYAAVDVITPVARQLVNEAWLLCFDEFQVTDIADAMILKRLFTEMFQNGMVMVATSNRAPEELYMNGLQRSNFIPFIPVLKKHCRVMSISGKDYRTANTSEIGEKYVLTGKKNAKVEMEEAFRKLCKFQNKRAGPKTLSVLGHQITFKNTCGRVLLVSFRELCGKDLGAADYIQIANNFDTILIKEIPKMSMDKRNEARRFILLIDTLYDKKVRIMVSAAVPPKNLFSGFSNESSPGISDQQRLIMDDLKIEAESENARASLFSGSEEIFAFQRAVSRIIEMCSDAYWKRYES